MAWIQPVSSPSKIPESSGRMAHTAWVDDVKVQGHMIDGGMVRIFWIFSLGAGIFPSFYVAFCDLGYFRAYIIISMSPPAPQNNGNHATNFDQHDGQKEFWSSIKQVQELHVILGFKLLTLAMKDYK